MARDAAFGFRSSRRASRNGDDAPSDRDRTEIRINELNFLMAGKAEANEPLKSRRSAIACSLHATSAGAVATRRSAWATTALQLGDERVSSVGVIHGTIHVFHNHFAHCSEVVRAHGLHRRRAFGREPER